MSRQTVSGPDITKEQSDRLLALQSLKALFDSLQGAVSQQERMIHTLEARVRVLEKQAMEGKSKHDPVPVLNLSSDDDEGDDSATEEDLSRLCRGHGGAVGDSEALPLGSSQPPCQASSAAPPALHSASETSQVLATMVALPHDHHTGSGLFQGRVEKRGGDAVLPIQNAQRKRARRDGLVYGYVFKPKFDNGGQLISYICKLPQLALPSFRSAVELFRKSVNEQLGILLALVSPGDSDSKLAQAPPTIFEDDSGVPGVELDATIVDQVKFLTTEKLSISEDLSTGDLTFHFVFEHPNSVLELPKAPKIDTIQTIDIYRCQFWPVKIFPGGLQFYDYFIPEEYLSLNPLGLQEESQVLFIALLNDCMSQVGPDLQRADKSNVQVVHIHAKYRLRVDANILHSLVGKVGSGMTMNCDGQITWQIKRNKRIDEYMKNSDKSAGSTLPFTL